METKNLIVKSNVFLFSRIKGEQNVHYPRFLTYLSAEHFSLLYTDGEVKVWKQVYVENKAHTNVDAFSWIWIFSIRHGVNTSRKTK